MPGATREGHLITPPALIFNTGSPHLQIYLAAETCISVIARRSLKRPRLRPEKMFSQRLHRPVGPEEERLTSFMTHDRQQSELRSRAIRQHSHIVVYLLIVLLKAVLVQKGSYKVTLSCGVQTTCCN